MRDCLSQYAEHCVKGKVRLFSVRDNTSGRRVADIGIRRCKSRDPWKVFDVRRFANTPAPGVIVRLALHIAHWYEVGAAKTGTREIRASPRAAVSTDS